MTGSHEGWFLSHDEGPKDPKAKKLERRLRRKNSEIFCNAMTTNTSIPFLIDGGVNDV